MESQLSTLTGPSFSLDPPRARESARAQGLFAFLGLTIGIGGRITCGISFQKSGKSLSPLLNFLFYSIDGLLPETPISEHAVGCLEPHLYKERLLLLMLQGACNRDVS